MNFEKCSHPCKHSYNKNVYFSHFRKLSCASLQSVKLSPYPVPQATTDMALATIQFCQVFGLYTIFLVKSHLLSVFFPSWAWKLISFSFLLFQNVHCMPLSFSLDIIISSFSFIWVHYRLWPQVIAQGVSMSKSFHLQISIILFLRPIKRNRRNLPNYSFVNSFILVIFFMAST